MSAALVLAILAASVAAVGAMVYVRYTAARDHVAEAVDAAGAFVRELKDNPEHTDESLKRARTELTAARKELDGFPLPMLRAFGPINHNLTIVTKVLDEYISVAERSGPTAVALVQAAHRAKHGKGGISDRLGAFAEFSSALQQAPDAVKNLRRARDTVDRIDETHAWPSVQGVVRDARRGLHQAYDALGPLADVVS